jgi:alkylation response protein AidB-like acyl-CoA dehydrogenase
MALLLNAEEEQFAGSVRRFVAERSPRASLRELMADGQPYHADVWRQMSAQLGLSGLIIPAEYGGAEATYAVLAVALTELGAGLVSSPLLATTLAAGVLLQLEDKDAQTRLLPGIASGELIATLALAGDVTVRADGGTLAGEVTPVLNAAQAGVLLVPALADGGIAVYEVDAAAAGLSVATAPALDHTRSVSTVRLDGVAGRPLAGDAARALGFAQDLANLAIAAEQLGAFGAALEMTVEYAKIRAAFGRPIGAFQGVKHRLANLRTDWELAHAALLDAVARVSVSDAYVAAATATIQLHGGIGFTWEHDAHLFYKNAISQNALFGDPEVQLDRLGTLLTAD